MPPKSARSPLGHWAGAASRALGYAVRSGQTLRRRASTIKQHDVENTTRGTFGYRPAYAASPCAVSWSCPTKRRGAWP